ncbi:hypothetical protein BS412_00740 [Cronobacter turicensis]|uniref:Uncharacterized protein n=1 Tax=Cronobacter turicensis TaxID=413502 RepID=A0A2T7B3H3_9ENTR|nr:hypothetical protein BS411_13380 [Cronobacter turicensis]PUX41681.1 hypothetical protein BS412_00740 [Cronobacter turicensis]
MDKTVRKVRIRAHHATSRGKVNPPEIVLSGRNRLSMNSLHLSTLALASFICYSSVKIIS